MPQRQPLSPMTNSLSTPQRPAPSKYTSPSTSRSLSIRSPVTTVGTFTDQDESQQKKGRRRQSLGYDLQRKALGSPAASTSSPRDNSELTGLSNAQLSSHYADCIKLSAENKINAKNAFGLHLIDYMTELVKKKELESFQVASSTLDASVKIYAGRVDHVHTHLYKVLSGLGGGKTANDKEDGEGEAAEGDEQAEAANKVKKKRRGKAKTIETNLKNINVDKFDLEFEVDPMFQMMSTAFDEGGARGLMLNRLQCFDNSQLLVLDSSTVVNVVEDSLPDSQSCRKPTPASLVTDMLANVNLEGKHICPSLANFCFTDRNSDTSVFSNVTGFAFDIAAEPDHLPNVEEDMENFANEEVDDGGSMVDDAPESNISGEASIQGGDTRTAEFVESAFSDLSNGSVGKLRQILALEPSDYSYFNKVMMRTWAGPAHWKVAPASRISLPGDAGSIANNTKKRQRKAPLRLAYDATCQTLDKMFKVVKSTTVTPATWGKYTKKKTTLPMDQQLNTHNALFTLFEKPKIMIKRQAADSIGVEDDIEAYDYNNKNDVENFCPAMQEGDDGDDSSSAGFDLSNEGNDTAFPHLSQSSQDGVGEDMDQLVAAPHRVDRIDIKYAKTAKKVDVRKLKSTMWNILTKSAKEAPKDKSVDTTPQPEVPPPKMDTSSKFDELVGEIPSHISGGMAKNLSVQNVFACLLYITNEKTLKLTSTENMDDIIIEQDN